MLVKQRILQKPFEDVFVVCHEAAVDRHVGHEESIEDVSDEVEAVDDDEHYYDLSVVEVAALLEGKPGKCDLLRWNKNQDIKNAQRSHYLEHLHGDTFMVD